MERYCWGGRAGATCCVYLETRGTHLALVVGQEWGAAGGDVANPEGWRSVGSAQFSLPALGTSLELTQAMMLG